MTERTRYTSPSSIVLLKEGIKNDINLLKEFMLTADAELKDLLELVTNRKETMLSILPDSTEGIKNIPVTNGAEQYYKYASEDIKDVISSAQNMYDKEVANGRFLAACMNGKGINDDLQDKLNKLYEEQSELVMVLKKSLTTGNIR